MIGFDIHASERQCGPLGVLEKRKAYLQGLACCREGTKLLSAVLWSQDS